MRTHIGALVCGETMVSRSLPDDNLLHILASNVSVHWWCCQKSGSPKSREHCLGPRDQALQLPLSAHHACKHALILAQHIHEVGVWNNDGVEIIASDQSNRTFFISCLHKVRAPRWWCENMHQKLCPWRCWPSSSPQHTWWWLCSSPLPMIEPSYSLCRCDTDCTDCGAQHAVKSKPHRLTQLLTTKPRSSCTDAAALIIEVSCNSKWR